ncbi:MAG: bifunctional diaminohydroxyphosphoribosylaminopyrimidine deaminase/5-amino-6-(5-phosphoribosylamino)uracil reductase RibD [Eubacterium sp.]|jgi:diaminohydroxyphosphoribosylaminopyrimidine deaminase/5-amino-6-(5-phosphoribosylamino)uracil reductase|nr:bifunctional diaminohydroxyphosphoribosylaminopyrimidine deaminase/5-amino-6-(5-phosphoribosylamino)uracil reductase RibD [Eubacterium sp.]
MRAKEKYMRRAIELARLGTGYTSPNPLVGCVIVKEDKILSEGYHEKYGEYHAERNAILRSTEDVTGADLYVTLEPCCHQGKTPPCADIIIKSGIRRVYIGSMDPNPLVAGKGVRILKEHGIEVKTGVLEEECQKLNEVFFHYIKTGLPYVVMKYAMTLDGKIACHTGDSKWVTGEEARRNVQMLRKKYQAIMVGIGTVLKDDPMLNCRIEKGVDPLRVICDSHLRIPLMSAIVKSAAEIPTVVFATDDSQSDKAKQLEAAGVEVCWQTGRDRVDLDELFKTLGERKIDSVLVEGGGTLNASLLQEGLVHKVYAFLAPKLVGGEKAKGPVMGNGIAKMCAAIVLKDTQIEQVGSDYCISGYIYSE